MIEVKNITKKYGSVTAVDNISFTINDGEIIGLLGPNGAGKRTTIKMLSGILLPTAGNIEIMGLNPFKDRKIRKLFTFSFEKRLTSRVYLAILSEQKKAGMAPPSSPVARATGLTW